VHAKVEKYLTSSWVIREAFLGRDPSGFGYRIGNANRARADGLYAPQIDAARVDRLRKAVRCSATRRRCILRRRIWHAWHGWRRSLGGSSSLPLRCESGKDVAEISHEGLANESQTKTLEANNAGRWWPRYFTDEASMRFV
jgi:hypothetical protein